MKQTYLAFDLGASSGRGILGTIEDGELSLEEIHRFENGPTEIDGSLFWAFEGLMGELKTGLRKALEVTKDISGIAVDTWGVDYVFLKEDGEFARPPYQYRDSRTDGVPEEVFENVISKEDLYAKTGLQTMFFNSIFQLYAHKRDHAEDFENTKLMFIPDALTWMFSGKVSCEYTIASTSGLLNAEKRDWDDEIIDKLGIPREVFPAISKPCTSAGTLTEAMQQEFGCGPIPVFHVGSHDTASAVGSVPAEAGNKYAYISCGTWALFGTETEEPILSDGAMAANCTNEGGLNNTIRFLTNINGTWILQETRRVWKESGKDISFAEMEDMAAAAEPSTFTFNPNDDAFMPPGDMPARIREMAGPGKLETDAEILRCIYDSLAKCFKEKLETFQELDNTKFDVLHIVGGGTKDKLLMQLTADQIGIPVVAGPIEATAIGNIIGQGIADGTIASLDEGRQIVKNSFEMDTFNPGQ